MGLFALLMFTTVWFYVDGSTVGTTAPPDPCDFYKPFPSSAKRSISNNKTHDLNDRFMIEDWYGIYELVIPTAPPNIGHCGTSYPIYLQDGPSMSEPNIQTITACILGLNNLCEREINIQCKVCSSSLVIYYLKKSPVSQSAYCLGSPTGDAIPDFTTTPSVIVTTEQDVASSPVQFRFFCRFTSSVNNLYYRADWYINNKLIYTSPLSTYNQDEERSLTEKRLKEKGVTSVGFDIVCEIRASFHTDTSAGLPSTSKPVFIGIKVLTPAVTVWEGETATIQIRPTAIIGCRNMVSCEYGITANIPEPDDVCSPTIRGDTACGVNIDPKNWNIVKSISVKGVISEQYGKITATMKITLRSADTYFDHPIWGNYTLTPVTVYVTKDTKKIEHRECKLYCDPHLRTFDKLHKSLQMEGTFTMYANPGYNIEVQVRTWPCATSIWGNAYCNCGMVVRVGRTVFMINHCSLSYWFIDYILCDDGGDIMDIKKHGSYYEIKLPTGTRLKANLQTIKGTDLLQVYIYPSVIDVGVTKGLCGNNNGIGSDDLQLRDGSITTDLNVFYRDWRASIEGNLFNSDNLGSLESWSRKYITCECHHDGGISNEVDCSPTNSAVTCSEDEHYQKVHQKRCIKPSRRRRSLPVFLPDSVRPKRIKRDVSWKNGWTAESAREYCEMLFNSSRMVTQCHDVPGVDFDSPIVDCQLDIQASGSDIFALSAVDAIRSQCLREAHMNVSLQEETPDKKSILELVKEVACPGECSNNGRCDNGTCICNDQFIGIDCSVNLSEPPLAANLEADGYCDVKEDDCTEIAVFGGTFVETSNSRCRIIPFEVNESTNVFNMASIITVPEIDSVGEVTCPLAVKRQKRSLLIPIMDESVPGYKVSVANNNVNFSKELTMVVMNSECMRCNITNGDVRCSFSIDYCIVNSQCYNNGAVYSSNPDYICRADSGGKFWENTNEATTSTTTVSKNHGYRLQVPVLNMIIIMLLFTKIIL